MAITKSGELLSPVYVEHIRSLACAFCNRAPRSQIHHWPTVGSAGTTDDTASLPACLWCHKRCHGETVIVDGKRMLAIPPGEQTAMVATVFAAFIKRGRWHAVEQVMRDLKRHRESVVFTELVPE